MEASSYQTYFVTKLHCFNFQNALKPDINSRNSSLIDASIPHACALSTTSNSLPSASEYHHNVCLSELCPFYVNIDNSFTIILAERTCY